MLPVHRRRSRVRSSAVVAFAAAILFVTIIGLTSACSDTSLRVLPNGIVVDVYQARFDIADHMLEVAVANGTFDDFVVTAMSFSSPAFHPATSYTRAPTTIVAGSTTNLRLLLPQADCHASAAPPRVTMSFTFRGSPGEARVTPVDRLQQLPSVAAEDCRDETVNAVATIAPADVIRYTSIAGKRVALLDITATPTGNGGTLVLDDVRGTVLLGLVNVATGTVGDTVNLGLDIGSAQKPVTVTLVLVPARCDPHVVLEDKRGTFFTFTVTTRKDTGRIFIGVSDALRIELYDFVGAECGWK